MRNASGMLVTPERRMSSWVITYTAAAAWESNWDFLETVVTSTLSRSSRLISKKSSPGSLAAKVLHAKPRATTKALSLHSRAVHGVGPGC